MIKYLEHPTSPNSYKVHLALHMLGLDHQQLETSAPQACPTHNQAHSSLSGLDADYARVSVLETTNGERISEANVALLRLAEGTDLYPAELSTQILDWLFFDQFHISTNIGTLRQWLTVESKDPKTLGTAYSARIPLIFDALEALDGHLQGGKFLTGDKITIADIAIYAHISQIEDAGVDLNGFCAIGKWVWDVEQQHGFIAFNDASACDAKAA